MSKPNLAVRTLREKLYKMLSPLLVLYVMGGCRPVLMEEPARQAGFTHVKRMFIGGKAQSEIILALKPSSEINSIEKKEMET